MGHCDTARELGGDGNLIEENCLGGMARSGAGLVEVGLIALSWVAG